MYPQFAEVSLLPNMTDQRMDVTPLATAILNGRLTTLIELLHLGYSTELRDRNGHTALHIAVIFGATRPFFNLLIRAKACVNALENRGLSPLTLSIANVCLPITELLLQAKADPNMGFGDRNISPLQRAAYSRQEEAIRLLLEYKSKIDHQSSNGATALMAAAAKDSIPCVKLLLERGADPDVETHLGEGQTRIECFGRTAYHSAKSTETKFCIWRYGFAWRVGRHHRAPQDIRKTVKLLTLIRSLNLESSFSLLPNELLFEIFYFIRASDYD